MGGKKKTVFAVKKLEQFSLSCPQCNEEIPSPETGSLLWSISEAIPAQIECAHCKITLRTHK